MQSRNYQSPDAVPQAVDREMTMIRAAIDLVASGGSPRVVLAGLKFVEALLAPSRELAAEAGVQIIPQWTAAEDPTDLAVERIAP